MRHGGAFTDYEAALKTIESIDGVVAATPFIFSQVMLRSKTGVSGAVLRGIDPQSAGQVITKLKADGLKKTLGPQGSGDGNPAARIPKIILGTELAKNLGVYAGGRVFLISPRGMLSPAGHMPLMKQFQVVDLFESGMYEYDGSLAYIHLADAQKILRMADAVTGIEVSVSDIYRIKPIKRAITETLGFPYWARDWMQMNKNLFSALKLEKTVMFIILALIVLVAAFNIAGSLIMMVMEKKRDIAILKAMGATNRSIRKIFVIKGMIIGSIGTSLGVLMGFVLCSLLKHYKFIDLPGDVYYITKLPVQLNGIDVGVIAAAAMVICFVSTLYPARQASRLNPVEAIRYG
jgi:lipoprotein-releasing system permease protein